MLQAGEGQAWRSQLTADMLVMQRALAPKLDELLAKQVELGEQVKAARNAREQAAEKRVKAEAHLAELHSRAALEKAPAAVRPPVVTVADTLLFEGIIKHIDPAVVQATWQAAGGETV